MIEIISVKYITEKEASKRYGFSTHWFKNQRWLKQGPPFVKLQGRGRVYYNLEKTDRWFVENIKNEE